VIKYWQLIDENRSVHRTPHGVTPACVSWGFKIQISKFHNTSRTNYRTEFGYVLRCAEELTEVTRLPPQIETESHPLGS